VTTIRWRLAGILVAVLLMPLVGASGGRALAAQTAPFACPPAGPATPAPASPGAAAVAASPLPFPPAGGELTVFAAASLTDAFERIAAALEAANPGLTVTYGFAGSQALVTQLNEGARADVFASANTAQMETAVANGSIAGEPVTFVRNRLAIVVPADNPAGIEAPADLGRDGLRLVLAQPEVPVGRYARESVCRMGQDAATSGEGFVERVAANVVSEEEDVREVLTKVQLGEADAGIVYVSDAQVGGDEVELIEIPDAVNIVAAYPVAAVAGGDEALAAAFIGYLLAPEGQATLAAYGFDPIARDDRGGVPPERAG